MRVLSLVTNPSARFYQQQVRTLRGQGVDVTTLSVAGDQYESQSDERSRSPLDYLRYVPQVRSEATNGYDLVHANYGLTAPAALAQTELPVVLSLWGSDLLGRFGWVGRAGARRSDEVVVMSEHMADELPCDAHVVPHGVDLDTFRPRDQAAAREDVGWDQDTKIVFFPYATSRDVKNYPLAARVVDAVDRVLDDDVELRTVSGVPHERMADYFNAADALLLTSKREGSPNTVKEALACNLPVVATDVGDVRERLAPVEPSAVCTSESELVATLVEVLERGERSDGRDHVADLDHDRVGERLRSVYQRALA